jgi:thiol-disulfide isomerase/thioredoxin
MRISPRLLTFGVTLFLSSAAGVRAAEDIGCDPGPSDKRVTPLVKDTSACGKDAACLETLEPRWQALFKETPRDMRAWWHYVGLYAAADRDKVERALRRQIEAHPRDPFYATVYGHVFPDKGDKIAAYRRALDLDPDYGWAHYYLAAQLTGRHGGPEGRDLEAATPHVIGWLKACPGDGAGMSMAALLPDKSIVAQAAASNRAATEAASGENALRRYPSLWSAEFKAVPTSEHEALRAHIRADVARLKTFGLEGSAAFWNTLDSAYELTGDTAERQAVQKELAARFPCESNVVHLRVQAWDKEHPRPDFFADEPVRRDYIAARYGFETEMAHACPGNVTVAGSRLRTAREKGDLSAAEAEDVIDDYLASRPKGTPAFTPAGMDDPAVELCVNYRVRLDRLSELIQAWRDSPKAPAPAADASESRRQSYESMRRRTEFDQLWFEARADHARGRTAERDAGLGKLKEMLDATTTYDRGGFEAKIAWLRADIAEADGKNADALVFYQQAYGGLRSDEFLLRASRAALKRLGASDETLATLQPPKRVRPTIFTQASPWKDADLKLPAASLERLGGGKWMLHDDLTGKRTLVDAWATWCGPCKKELPELQKLYERIKGRSDVAVVALNVDDNPGLVEPFIKENGYTFPVVLGGSYWESLRLENNGIPTNWIVEEKGVVRSELRGWSESSASGGKTWVDHALARLEGKSEPKTTTTETKTIVVEK